MIPCWIYDILARGTFYLKTAFFHPATGLEVGADALAGALLELWELAATGLDYGLDFLLGLFGDGHHAVQILIHKQTHKHLTETERGGGERGDVEQKNGAGVWGVRVENKREGKGRKGMGEH